MRLSAHRAEDALGADRIDRAASELFGWESVRDGQRRSVEALLEGRDVVAVMPTGAGKSAVYQLAGALRDGLTLVVSPLIALQTDQLEQLSAAPAAPRGAAVNSSLGARAIEDAWAQAESGGIRFLFLAPEQLAKDEVLDRLAGLDVGLLVVDEAHCVASWGHDFRPDYLRLGDARERLGGPPTVALTATAAEPVREEIVRRLSLEDPLLVVQGVDRPNIDLEVRRHADESEKRQHLLDLVAELDGCGLVYAATRRDAEEYASALAERGIRSLAYHAGLPAKDRRAVQEAFHVGDVDVVVATSAFGMGIDKPDVRFVVHASVPESLDAYYQEVGRAGRDGEAARAVLFYRSEDLGIRKYFTSRSVDQARLRAAYKAVVAAGAPIRAAALALAVRVSSRAITGIVNLLVEAGAVRVTRAGIEAVGALTTRQVVARSVEASDRRERIEVSRLEVMRRYAETRDCRRRVLLSYFGDELDEPCGRCDTCRAGTASVHEEEQDAATAPFPSGSTVRHAAWGEGSVVEVDPDRLTVFFPSEGYKVLALDVVQEGDLLRRVA